MLLPPLAGSGEDPTSCRKAAAAGGETGRTRGGEAGAAHCRCARSRGDARHAIGGIGGSNRVANATSVLESSARINNQGGTSAARTASSSNSVGNGVSFTQSNDYRTTSTDERRDNSRLPVTDATNVRATVPFVQNQAGGSGQYVRPYYEPQQQNQPRHPRRPEHEARRPRALLLHGVFRPRPRPRRLPGRSCPPCDMNDAWSLGEHITALHRAPTSGPFGK